MQPIPRRLCLCGVCVELTQRLADDLDSAFPELVMQHQDLVYGVALRVVGNAADAEDVAQDAFLRAHRALCGGPNLGSEAASVACQDCAQPGP
jgi:DNA-directed RNA polymerase specialized sigma24 family protein